MDTQFKTIHPAKYLRDHFASNIRPDGREFQQFRPVSINVSSITQADSSAVFKIGNTAVVCGIKAELACPKAETPDCGFVIPNVELPPLSSPKFRPGPPCDEAQCLTKLVDNILMNSEAVDLKDLCICKDKLAWVLYCDIVCIDYDGSVIDACIGALMSALSVLTLPEVDYKAETDSIVVNDKSRIPVQLKHIAVSTTVALFEEQLLISDPLEDEEKFALTTLTIVFNEDKICFCHKSGGAPIIQEVLCKCISRARSHGELVRKVITRAALSLTSSS